MKKALFVSLILLALVVSPVIAQHPNTFADSLANNIAVLAHRQHLPDTTAIKLLLEAAKAAEISHPLQGVALSEKAAALATATRSHYWHSRAQLALARNHLLLGNYEEEGRNV